MVLKQRIFLLYLAIFPLFFTNVSIPSLLSSEINTFGNLTSVLIIVFTFLLYPIPLRKVVYILLFIVLTSIHVFFTPPLFKYWLAGVYYLLPALLIPFLYTADEFLQTFVHVVSITLPIFLFLFFFGIGVDLGYGTPRLQGFMTEPSHLATIAPITLLYGLEKKKRIMLAISILVVILSRSPTCYLVCIVAYFLNLFLRLKKRYIVVGFIAAVFCVYYSIEILEFIEILFPNKGFQRLAEGLRSVTSLGQAGYNLRFSNSINLLDNTTPMVYFFGGGIAYNDYLSYLINQTNGSNIILTILLSFGILGITIFIYYVMKCLSVLRTYFYELPLLRIFFLSLVCYTLINSAGGMIFYCFVFISMIYILRHNKHNRKPKSDRKNTFANTKP